MATIDGDLQTAISNAEPGDVIVLEAGRSYTGNFVLPPKPPGEPITITSSSAALPDRRIGPDDSPLLPVIRSGNGGSALRTEGAAVKNWIIRGVAFESNLGGHGDIIGLDGASHIYMDRLLIVAGPDGQKRAIQGNGTDITLRRSHLANIWREGQDSQCFCAWDGAGPYTIVDNYLEAASENVMFGGADSGGPDRVPAHIVVEGNHCSKRLEWKGQRRNVKNLFELKAARHVLVRHNLFEHNWPDGQNGTAIQITVRNDDGLAPWSVIEDVLFQENIIRDTEGVFNILGYNDGDPSGRCTRITIRKTLCLGTGYFAQIGGEVGELTFDHNTVEQGKNFFTMYKGDVWPAGEPAKRPAAFAVEQLIVTNTLGYHRDYGVFGDSVGSGTPALDAMAVSYHWTHNVLAGAPAHVPYPDVTWKPTVEDHAAQFLPDYRLVEGSPYRGAATDGTDLGAMDDAVPQPEPEQLPMVVQFQGKTYRGVLTADP